MKLTIHVVLEEESHGGWSLNKNNIILPIISKKTILKKHNRIIGVVEQMSYNLNTVSVSDLC